MNRAIALKAMAARRTWSCMAGLGGDKSRMCYRTRIQRVSSSSARGGETDEMRTIQEENRQRALKYLQENTKELSEQDALFIADDERSSKDEGLTNMEQRKGDDSAPKDSTARDAARRRLQRYVQEASGDLPSVETLCKMLEVEHGAVNVVVIDVREKAVFTDWFVVASGLSVRHVIGIADGIGNDLRAAKAGSNVGKFRTNNIALSGRDSGHWIVVDGGYVIIHVMTEETRQAYALEQLWTEDDSGAVFAENEDAHDKSE